jgi:PilZ domain
VGSGQQRQSCFYCQLPTANCQLLMSTPYNDEKRLTLRMALRLPIVVSGRSEDGAAWSEPTETDDISTGGALFHLNQRVNRGERLYLRAHRPDGAPIEVTVMVVRVAPAIYGTARVGVSISDPVENWLRLFVSWVADEQPAQPDAENESPAPE